jgi:hypothetical protein
MRWLRSFVADSSGWQCFFRGGAIGFLRKERKGAALVIPHTPCGMTRFLMVS